jgi:hypothetical protein
VTTKVVLFAFQTNMNISKLKKVKKYYAIMSKDLIVNKYKTFSVLIYSYINTSGIGKTRNDQHEWNWAECFPTISSFPNFHEC